MLIGKDTVVTRKLVQQISRIHPIEFLEYRSDLESLLAGIEDAPRLIFVNLLDLGGEIAMPRAIKRVLPRSTLVGIHCYQAKNMIAVLYKNGFNKYISIFHLSDELPKILFEFKREHGID